MADQPGGDASCTARAMEGGAWTEGGISGLSINSGLHSDCPSRSPASREEERVSGARSSKKRSRASTTPSCWGPLRGQLAKIEEREGLDSPRWAQAVASLLADSGEGAPAVHMAELRGMLRILGLLRAIPESHAADVAAVLVSVLACLLATVPGGEALQAGSAASEVCDPQSWGCSALAPQTPCQLKQPLAPSLCTCPTLTHTLLCSGGFRLGAQRAQHAAGLLRL